MKHIKHGWLIVPLALFLSCSLAGGAIIFQSALSGGYGGDSGSTIGGYSGSGQILGAAFSLSQTVHVESIGGLFSHSPQDRPDDIFGVIVRLSSTSAIPIGNPFDMSEVLGSAVFHVGSSVGVDVLAPLSLDLTPGDYAVVFGSGYFGATGIAAAPAAGGSLSSRYLYWGDSFGATSWHEGGHTSERFVVMGTVPESGVASFLGIGIAGMVTRRSRRRI